MQCQSCTQTSSMSEGQLSALLDFPTVRYSVLKDNESDIEIGEICLIYSCLGRSGGSSGRAVGYQVRGSGFESQAGPNQFIIAPLCPPSTKRVARNLKTRRK
ncbi:hypothetical protein PoB_001366100 [Plakobranchus ocellatus]|uniref:Uncharacterized protein n=1 Tax=Plakobranchus ocellatus TaxID=259542 RepID=A0AAV3YIQ5_9GAST|nr:hypothetical protein PoB_001366100 [Plakobranchus ocellatus]